MSHSASGHENTRGRTMRNARAVVKLLATGAIGIVIYAAHATATTPVPTKTASGETYSDAVEAACLEDYIRHCVGYPIGSASLRLCMESKSRDLSKICVTALVDAGLVDRRRLKRGY